MEAIFEIAPFSTLMANLATIIATQDILADLSVIKSSASQSHHTARS